MDPEIFSRRPDRLVRRPVPAVGLAPSAGYFFSSPPVACRATLSPVITNTTWPFEAL